MTTASPQVCDPIVMTSTPELVGFAELYRRHYEAVFRAALRVTGNPADAEDVLQTVFVRVLRSDGHESAQRPAAYFRRAAVNAAVDLLRRRTAHAETAYDESAAHMAAQQPPLLLKERLRRAIATLDTDDATLVLLRHVEGLSNEELASAFQIEKNNVAVRLHRIRIRLQAEMDR